MAKGGAALRVCDPETFEAPDDWDWLPLQMCANVPHVRAKFQGGETEFNTELFMLDSGAGGADCIFHDRAVKRAMGMDLSVDGYVLLRSLSDFTPFALFIQVSLWIPRSSL